MDEGSTGILYYWPAPSTMNMDVRAKDGDTLVLYSFPSIKKEIKLQLSLIHWSGLCSRFAILMIWGFFHDSSCSSAHEMTLWYSFFSSLIYHYALSGRSRAWFSPCLLSSCPLLAESCSKGVEARYIYQWSALADNRLLKSAASGDIAHRTCRVLGKEWNWMVNLFLESWRSSVAHLILSLEFSSSVE